MRISGRPARNLGGKGLRAHETMKLLSALIVGVSIFSVVPTGLATAGDGQWTGLTQCFINGRWVTVRGNCPAPSGGGASSGGGGSSSSGGTGAAGGLYGGFYSLGYAFGQWLAGGGSDPQAEARRREMMAELQRRQAEAERQKREEEARRLAAIYNRLTKTLKLSGTPELQLKGAAGSGQGLKLKIGDGAGGRAGIDGLPGIYLNDGGKPYGIPGLPGIYTGGPGQGSGLTASGMKLKIGGESAAAAPPAQPANATPAPDVPAAQFNPSKMTPQQLADVAEMFSRLPPEEQARMMTMAQKGAPVSLSRQSDASRAAASAPTLEGASDRARAGFDRPLEATPPAGIARAEARQDSERAPSTSRPAASSPPSSAGTPAATRPEEPAPSGIDADAAAKAGGNGAGAVRLPPTGAVPTSGPKLALKLSNPSPAAKAPEPAPQAARWRKAVDCAVGDVYARAESLGPDGVRFANELRETVARAVAEADRTPMDGDDVTIVNTGLDRMVAESGGAAPRQSIVKAAVHRVGNGDVVVDVMSHLAGWEGQVNLKFDRNGVVEVRDSYPSVMECLGR